MKHEIFLSQSLLAFDVLADHLFNRFMLCSHLLRVSKHQQSNVLQSCKVQLSLYSRSTFLIRLFEW